MKIELTSEDIKIIKDVLRDKIMYYHDNAVRSEKCGLKNNMLVYCELENQIQEVLDKFDN